MLCCDLVGFHIYLSMAKMNLFLRVELFDSKIEVVYVSNVGLISESGCPC